MPEGLRRARFRSLAPEAVFMRTGRASSEDASSRRIHLSRYRYPLGWPR